MPRAIKGSEYKALFRELYQYAPVGIEQVALNGRLLMVNAALCEMLGYSEAELLTKTFEEITHPDDRAGESKLLARLLKGELERYQLEKRYMHKSGSAVWVSLNSTLVRRGKRTAFRISVVNNIAERKQAEEQAKQSRVLLEKFVEDAPAGLAMFNRDMRYVLASKRWLDDCGVGKRAIIGKSHYEIFPDLPGHWKEAHRRGLAGETLKAEEDWTALDGHNHSIRWEIHPWGDAGTESGGIIIFLEDITDRRRTEQERQKFVLLADNSREFIGMCDMNFMPFYVNQAGLHLVGLNNLEESCRTPVQEFFFPEDQRFIMEEFFPRVQREGRGEVEIRFRHFKTGKPLWMLYNVFYIKDTTGQPVGLATVSRDITERKKGEEALRRSEERLSSIIGSAMDAIITLDNDLNIVVFNAAAEKIFHCSDSEVLGKPIDRFLPQRFREIHRGHIQKFAHTGITARSMSSPGTLYGLRADGEEFPLEATISQSSTGGQRLYTVILRDITQRTQSEAKIKRLVADRSQVEEELERLRQVSGRLLQADDQERRAIAHELHESVAQYLAALELTLAAARKAAVSPKVHRLLGEGNSLLELCCSQIRTMAYALHPSVLDIFGLQAAIESHVQSLTKRSGMEIDTEFPPGLDRLPGDIELALFRILQETLNKIHQSGGNGAKVRVFLDGGEIGLEVSGNGRELPPDQRSAMQGAGIEGMRERVRILGGRLEAPNNGTTLRAVLPVIARSHG